MQILLAVHTPLLKDILTFISLNLNIVNSLAKLLLKIEVLINHQHITKDLLAHLPSLEQAAPRIINQLHRPLGTLQDNRKAIVMQLNRGTLALGKATIRIDKMILTSMD
jgi:hypothetical protein